MNPDDITLSHLWDLTRDQLPMPVARRSYPHAPANYTSWKAGLAGTLNSLFVSAHFRKLGKPVPENTQSQAFLSLSASKHDFPLVWVDQSLLECLLRSDPPTEFALGDLKWPFSAVTFLLPKGTLTHAKHGDCSWLVIGQVEVGPYRCPLTGDLTISGNSTVTAVTAPVNDPDCPIFNFSIDADPATLPFRSLPDSGPATVDDYDPIKNKRIASGLA